ncbi:MAG: 23S rRNA (pseudouridine(1915)-N(3))-methyltransferase RlmH [Alphaproteobacteria bacterium]|nr:MAG: 23S rRNA (pseudouridine(1915)-N(3))-methyltransferase RlmH [Alphaproteobacteria bacterium]
MDVTIAAVGRLKAGRERDLCAHYLERAEKIGRVSGFHRFLVREVPESRAARAADRMAQEAQRLQERVGLQDQSGPKKRTAPPGRLICLDERGSAWTSDRFAGWLRDQADSAAADTIIVAIGGADGLSSELVATADVVLSLGRMTWPHQIVRVLIAEQLYRAMTILAGHPYHRA